MRRTGQRGQAAVETIGVAIGLTMLVLLGWQAIVAAGTWQTAQSAARSAARAGQVGAPVERAALAVLPDRLAKRAHVTTRTGHDGVERVRVRLVIPSVVPWVGRIGSVTAEVEVATP